MGHDTFPSFVWVGDSLRLDTSYMFKMADGRQCCIPRGWVTDGASIPRIFWSIIGHPFLSIYRDAALRHDVQYELGVVARDLIDQQFLRDLKTAGMGILKRTMMYSAVRLAGGQHYNTGENLSLLGLVHFY